MQPQGLNYYPLYGQNERNMPLYPANYNNLLNNNQEKPKHDNSLNALDNATNLTTSNKEVKEENKTEQNSSAQEEKKKEEEKEKTIVPLTDDYIKSLENYLNNNNAKIRLIGAKEVLERFKEDENRKDNPSLMPLLNKILKDSSPSVRFLGLTALQLGYCVGNDETISLLKQIQQKGNNDLGDSQDSLLASEILLKMSAPEAIKVKSGDEK